MRRIISAALLLCLGTAPVLLATPAFADTTGGRDLMPRVALW